MKLSIPEREGWLADGGRLPALFEPSVVEEALREHQAKLKPELLPHPGCWPRGCTPGRRSGADSRSRNETDQPARMRPKRLSAQAAEIAGR
jgi:hypothetical protein